MLTTYVEPLQDKPDENDEQYESKKQEYDDYESNNQYNDDDDDDESPQKASYNSDSNNDVDYSNKKKEAGMTVDEFKSARLDLLFDADDDFFDIGKKICHFYDDKFGDSDTVCLVATTDNAPAISYWVRGQYVRKDPDVHGKHIMVYRACKHVPPNEPILTQAEFEKYVKDLSEEYEQESVDTIGDMMDKKLGDGCHYARSTIENNHYDVYARFKHQYDASFKLQSGSYVITWRR